MNVPRLRFKDDDGREFPEWEEKELGNIAKNIGGTALEEYVSAEGTHNFVSIGNYEKDGHYFDNGQRVILNSKTKSKLLNAGDLVMVLNDKTSSGDLIGATILIQEDNKFIYNQRSEKLICDLTIIDPKFTWYFLNSEKFRKSVFSISQGGTQIYVNFSSVKKLIIPIPSLPEQTKIANFLTAIDEKITQLTQKCDLLAQYKKGVMQQIFSQKLRFKDDDGQEFPEWKERKLDDIAQIVGGGTPETGIKEYWNGNIQWFTPTELKSKYAKKSQRTITELGLRNSSAKILPVGTLLFSSRATVGDVSIALNPCTTNQGFQSLIVNDQNNNEFIYYWILNNKKAFLEKASGSTFLEVNKKEIEKLSIQLPVLKEQTKIANFLTAIDEKITQAQAQLEAVKLYKKGLLQRMFV